MKSSFRWFDKSVSGLEIGINIGSMFRQFKLCS